MLARCGVRGIWFKRTFVESVAAASAAGTPTSLALQRFGHFNGAITRNGLALGNVISAEVTYSNGLDRIETIRSDGRIEGADPGMAALTGRVGQYLGPRTGVGPPNRSRKETGAEPGTAGAAGTDLDWLRAAGFSDALIRTIWSIRRGIVSAGTACVLVLVAVR